MIYKVGNPIGFPTFLLNVVKKLLLLSFCCTFACEFGIMCTYVNKEKTQE